MRFYFHFIAILNLADCLFTWIALKNSIVGEANPIMAFLWQVDPVLFVGVKVLLSAGLFFLAAAFQPNEKRKRLWKWTLQLTSLLYVYIFFAHLTWIVIYFFETSFSV